jgi:Domain of unknown function (DUF4349)/Putative zinc-finger
MSEHAWVLENLAAYVAGGLAAEERERLQQHVADCADCARALEELRAADAELEALFAPVRPGPELEDRSIAALRQGPPRRARRILRVSKAVLALAAGVLVVFLGAAVYALDQERMLAFPDTLFALEAGESASSDQIDSLSRLILGANQDGLGDSSVYRLAHAGDEPTRLDLAKMRGLKDNFWADQSALGKAPEEATATLQAAVKKTQEAQARVDVINGVVREAGRKGVMVSSDDYAAAVRARDRSKQEEAVIRQRLESNKPGTGGEPLNELGLYPPALALVARDTGRTQVKQTGGYLGGKYFKPGDVLSAGEGGNPRVYPVGDLVLGRAEVKQGDKSNLSDMSRTETSESLAQKKAPATVLNMPAPATPAPVNGRSEGNRPAKAAGEPARIVAQEGPGKTGKTASPSEPAGRKIIRSGAIDFEVDSFDNAVAVITRLIAAAKGGFIATVNSDKLSNGKMRGAVVVRIPPEKLDAFVLDLRKELASMGDLKGQRIGSDDISKKYTDLESQLRAARTMEERLLKIIKEGKGQVKDLVLAEKELGNWRTKVEELEGELRFYAHQVALSTLTINLTEKEIRQAAVVTEIERVTTGIEVEDVEKAFRAALAAVAEANGRVTKSDLKQHSAGQFNAVLHFEVLPDAAGTVRDRLKQLGTVARLDIDRVQQAEGGEMAVKNGKLKRGPTQFLVSLYNLVNVAPRETVVLKVAAGDVAAAYRMLRAAIEKAQGRVTNAALNEQDQQNISAQLDFDIRRAGEETLQAALGGAGEVLSRQVTRQPAGENVTDAKVQFNVVLVSARTIPPRETTALVVEVADVDQALAVLGAQVRDAGGRGEAQQRHQDPSGRITVQAPYVVPLSAAPGLVARIRTIGRLREQRDTTNEQAPAGKLVLARLEVTWTNAEQLVPGESGLWAQLRRGLSFSLRGLAVSASWLLVGVLVVLPWVLLVYFIIWLVRRLWRTSGTSTAPVTPTSGTP